MVILLPQLLPCPVTSARGLYHVGLCEIHYSPVSDVDGANEQVHLINCMGQHSTTWTGVFPCGVLWNSLTWITWSLLWGLPRCQARQGIPSPSRAHTHSTHAHSRRVPHRHVTSALTHFHQSNDVIKALMRDYSDITGKAAKLNLLASPCAFACVKSERPLGQVVHGGERMLAANPHCHPSMPMHLWRPGLVPHAKRTDFVLNCWTFGKRCLTKATQIKWGNFPQFYWEVLKILHSAPELLYVSQNTLKIFQFLDGYSTKAKCLKL